MRCMLKYLMFVELVSYMYYSVSHYIVNQGMMIDDTYFSAKRVHANLDQLLKTNGKQLDVEFHKKFKKDYSWRDLYVLMFNNFLLGRIRIDDNMNDKINAILKMYFPNAQPFRKVDNHEVRHTPPILSFINQPISCMYKPLALQCLLKLSGCAAYQYMKRHFELKQFNRYQYWVKFKSTEYKTIIFVHGCGGGAIPYMNFLLRFDHYNIVMMELPNVLNFYSYRNPTADDYYKFKEHIYETYQTNLVLMGHSLGTHAVSCMLNMAANNQDSCGELNANGELNAVGAAKQHHDNHVDKVVLLDPVALEWRPIVAHQLPTWSIHDCIDKFGFLRGMGFWYMVVKDVCIQNQLLRSNHNLLYNQFKPTTIPTFVLLGKRDVFIGGGNAFVEYLEAFPTIITYLDDKANHGSFLSNRFFEKRLWDELNVFLQHNLPFTD